MNDTAVTYRPRTVDPLMARVQRILRGAASFDDRHVTDHKDLVRLVEFLGQSDCVIAFVTGVWDLFHIGHADYLQAGKDAAKALYPDRAVVLVVGYDSDEVTLARKGPGRPVVPDSERAKVLSHVRAVDIITPQSEENQLFALIRHDVRIISKSTKDLPNRSVIESRCEHLVELPPQAETSTTARVQRLALTGKFDALKELLEKLAPLAELSRLIDEVRTNVEEARRELTK